MSLIQAVCSGNASTVAFVMMPQWHSSTSRSTTVKNRRLVEDKLMGTLG